ncbi:IS66 family insertion sequence element accessory protein TnpA, partial [Leptospira interrogans]|uniref:IS66 family insertion sequence element accessory protein TnpA n=1 Tax=Leptospira interrogans TaxID=173 RepID=UPI00046C5C0C
KSGLSQPQYCKEGRLKYTTFRYHWERRFKNQNEDGFVEVPNSVVNVSSASGSEFLILKIDSSGKAHLQMNLQLSLGIWS